MDKIAQQSPINAFLAQSEQRLRGRISRAKIATTLAEAREHLTYRAEELMESGLTLEAAEAAAAEAFGKPREWAKEILMSENYKPYLQAANNISIGGFTVFLFTAPLTVMALADFGRGHFDTCFNVIQITWIAFAIAVLGALVARRFAFRAFAAALAAAIVVTYLVVGISVKPLGKIMTQRIQILDTQVTLQDDLDRLKLGEQVYAASALPTLVPARLRGPLNGPYTDKATSAANFIADWLHLPEADKSTFVSPTVSKAPPSALKTRFGYLAPILRSQPAPLGVLTQGSLQAVATKEIAARRWREFGDARLAECARGLSELEKRPINHLTALQTLSTFKVGNFDSEIAKGISYMVFYQGLICLAFCFLHAMLGRFLHRAALLLSGQMKAPQSPLF
ncbi:MAG: hypothetical protein JWQ02_1346 [Capsulimonas sp.]|nr:hypothetical protein [Capsulimonas sp.]